MRECYPIIIGNLYQRPPHLTFVCASERYGYWYSPRTRTHQHARLRARERGEVSPRSTRRERRRILAPAVGEGATARVSFSSACARGRVFDRPKVLVAGVSVARAAARRFHERARGPSRRLPPRARHGSVRLPPARGRRGRRRRRLPRLQGANLHEGANDLPRARGSLPRGPAPASPPPPWRPSRPHPAHRQRRARRRPPPRQPRPDRRRAPRAPARGAAPSSLLEASTRRRAATARATKKRERTRNYAPSRTPCHDASEARRSSRPNATSPPPRRRSPPRSKTPSPTPTSRGQTRRPSPTSSRTTSSTEPSMATARWVRRRRSRR